jgi:DNA-directed RNA polymerase specialized sigma24 family protein
MKARGAARPDNDSGWLCGIQVRDRDALEKVYRNYSGRIFHFLSIVAPGQAAEEACLDVFAELWHGAAESPPGYALADWLFCLAYRVLRKRASVAEGCSCGQPLINCRVSPSDSGQTPRVQLRNAMQALALDQRVVVGLVYGMDMSRERISRITGMSVEQITAHLSEARERLRHEATVPVIGF